MIWFVLEIYRESKLLELSVFVRKNAILLYYIFIKLIVDDDGLMIMWAWRDCFRLLLLFIFCNHIPTDTLVFPLNKNKKVVRLKKKNPIILLCFLYHTCYFIWMTRQVGSFIFVVILPTDLHRNSKLTNNLKETSLLYGCQTVTQFT